MLGSMIHGVESIPDYSTSNLQLVITLRNLSTALSSCIYECLCDSDNILITSSRQGDERERTSSDVGLEGFSTCVVYNDSCLMAGARKKHHSQAGSEIDTPTSSPSNWPGE